MTTGNLDHVTGAGAQQMSQDRASWSGRIGDDGSLGVGKSGTGGFDPMRLRAARERARLTQRDLAERLLRATRPEWPGDNIIRAAQDLDNVRLQITDYEAGQVTPRAEMAYQLAQALGVDVFDMLDPDTPYTLPILRARLGLTQDDVVTRGLGVGRAYYSRAERGGATFSDDQRIRLAEILQVDLADLAAAIDGGRTVGSIMKPGKGRRRQAN